MNEFFVIRKSSFFSTTLLLYILLFLLPLSAFGQLAKADTGIIYGSTGLTDGGRLLTFDKINGDATPIYETGLNNIPAIAINSMGNIYAINASRQLYKISADSAQAEYINTVDVSNLPAIAFDHKNELYGIGYVLEEGEEHNDYWQLIKIDTSTADFDVLFRLNVDLTHRYDGNWTGMTFNPADGNIYASAALGDVFLINPHTGQTDWLAHIQNNYYIDDLTFDNDENLFLILQGEGSHLALFNDMDSAAIFIGGSAISDVKGLASRTLRRQGAQIGVFPNEMDFGLYGLDGLYTRPLTLRNIGTENLLISAITMDAPFSVEDVSWPLIIEPDSSIILDLIFTPEEINVFSDNIVISSNDVDNPEVTIPVYAESDEAPLGILFGIEADDGLLLAINPESGESDTLTIIYEDDDDIDYITEIEFRQDGTLFIARGDGYAELYTYNVLNYFGKYIGEHDRNGLPGMDFSPDGILYAVHTVSSSDTSTLVIINQDNADLEYIGKTGYKRVRGLSFSPNGTLYGVAPDWADTSDILVTIDIETGTATKIGHTGFNKVTALEFGPDSVLYGGLGDDLGDTLNGALISIDPTTGGGTFIGLTGAHVLSGLSFFPDLTIRGPITSLSGNSNDVPEGLYLAQNFPNPFNPNTNIKFSLDRPTKVSLKIYNIAGQLVKTLFSEQLDSGSHIYNWNASDFSSGLYFYQLKAGSHSFTKKAILIK